MITYKENTKTAIKQLLERKTLDEIELRKLVFDYCKQEGLVAASREFDINNPIAYKKIIREEFGLII